MSWWIWTLIGLVLIIAIVIIAVKVAINCICDSSAGLIVKVLTKVFSNLNKN